MLSTRQHFHEELEILEQQLLHMGTLTSRMVMDAVDALQRGDGALAEAVIAQDDRIDAMDMDIEIRCIELLALQQPMARDLRQISTALKVITDLERIGDHAVDIAKISRKFTQRLFVSKPLVDLGPLAALAERMLAQSLKALVRHDIELARQICADDDRVDTEFRAVREELLRLAQEDGAAIVPASYLLLAAVYLERVADHATNMAERIHYIETGYLEQLARSHRRDSALNVG